MSRLVPTIVICVAFIAAVALIDYLDRKYGDK